MSIELWHLLGSVESDDSEPGMMIAFYSSVIWKSEDGGKNWTKMIQNLNINVSAVGYSEVSGRMIVCNASGATYYSDDGLQWFAGGNMPVMVGGSPNWNCLRWFPNGGGIWLATNHMSSQGDPNCAYSIDEGETWVSNDVGGVRGVGMASFGGTIGVGLSQNFSGAGGIAFSSDGMSWVVDVMLSADYNCPSPPSPPGYCGYSDQRSHYLINNEDRTLGRIISGRYGGDPKSTMYTFENSSFSGQNDLIPGMAMDGNTHYSGTYNKNNNFLFVCAHGHVITDSQAIVGKLPDLSWNVVLADYLTNRFVVMSTTSVKCTDDNGATFYDATTKPTIGAPTAGIVIPYTPNLVSPVGYVAMTAAPFAGYSRMWLSRDGIAWSDVHTGFGTGNVPLILKFGNGRYLFCFSGSPSTTWRSKTGAVLEAVSLAPSTATSFTCLVYGNGIWVGMVTSATSFGRILTSTDTISWTQRTEPAGFQYTMLAFGNNQFIGMRAATTNGLIYSADGINWTAGNLPQSSNWLVAVYGNGVWVALSSNGTNRVMTSVDGINWSLRTASIVAAWTDIAFGNGTFVAIGNAGECMTSTDGISWTTQTFSPALKATTSIVFAQGKFTVASGDNGETDNISYSTDGVSWTAVSGVSSGATIPRFNARQLVYGS